MSKSSQPKQIPMEVVMFRKILFLALALALVFALAVPVVMSQQDHSVGDEAVLTTSIFDFSHSAVKADPDCPVPVCIGVGGG
jgi:hypothetical protein